MNRNRRSRPTYHSRLVAVCIVFSIEFIGSKGGQVRINETTDKTIFAQILKESTMVIASWLRNRSTYLAAEIAAQTIVSIGLQIRSKCNIFMIFLTFFWSSFSPRGALATASVVIDFLRLLLFISLHIFTKVYIAVGKCFSLKSHAMTSRQLYMYTRRQFNIIRNLWKCLNASKSLPKSNAPLSPSRKERSFSWHVEIFELQTCLTFSLCCFVDNETYSQT